MIYKRKSSHIHGLLPAADFIAALFFNKLRLDPQQPNWPDRNRFSLSKGYASALLYTVLAPCSFFPQSDLNGWGELSCHLQDHPDRIKTPGEAILENYPTPPVRVDFKEKLTVTGLDLESQMVYLGLNLDHITHAAMMVLKKKDDLKNQVFNHKKGGSKCTIILSPFPLVLL